MADEVKSPTDVEFEQREAAVKAENAKRSGKGTRLKAGRTRGKGSIVITYEQFDESLPETLPVSIKEFMDLTGVQDEPSLVGNLIAGFNDSSYTAASDPLAEYVEATWPTDAQAQFRIVVRNYARGAVVSLEDAVALIKPGFSNYQARVLELVAKLG